MTESLSSASSVSKQVFAEIRAAFNAYSKNIQTSEDDENKKVYTDRGQVTRKALADIQENFPRKIETEDETETETNDENTQVQTQSAQTNSTQTQETNNNVRVEAKQFTLPKNTDTIIAELKRNGLHRTLSAYDIADKYSISYMKAREILDKVNQDSNGFIREYKLPENSTISYKV